jgi:hypothetical protein
MILVKFLPPEQKADGWYSRVADALPMVNLKRSERSFENLPALFATRK